MMQKKHIQKFNEGHDNNVKFWARFDNKALDFCRKKVLDLDAVGEI